ncbi:uncharacterized protein LOC125959189 [Anopheles darlingi]|uniref:uncharacterized protein LOC125959189 n=1 Tax=Anopheles darlingi TaxID=43151 RepID=UPI0020FFF7CF|nr:uncharacterized protein LOC125959189 [Anopheles darlingi]
MHWGILLLIGVTVALPEQQQQQQQQQQQKPPIPQAQAPLGSNGEKTFQLENPAYDPTLYQKFLPQDAVQQYVHSYTGQPYPATIYGGGSPFDPTATAFAAIPTGGFEGFLIPAPAEKEQPSLLTSLRTLLPSARSLVTFVGRLASVLIGSIGVLLFGAILTSLTCFFTPFCTLSFRNAKFLTGAQDAAEDIAQVVGEQVTADRVKRAAEFLYTAIDKFQRLNNIVKEATERKAPPPARAAMSSSWPGASGIRPTH